MRPAAVIFDVDGTLAETEEVHRLAFDDAFADAGLGWSWDVSLYRRLLQVTGGKERIRHYVEGAGLAPLDPDAVAALHAFKTRRFVERAAAGDLALRPGVARLIHAARAAALPLAIATTTSLPNVQSLLATTLGADAVEWFAAIGAGDVVAAKKPARDIYEWVLKRLGVSGTDCIAFEDSRNGLLSAMGAGVPTVITVSSFTDDHDFTGALAVLDHLGEAGLPCRASAGRTPAGGCVTLDDLTRWLAPA